MSIASEISALTADKTAIASAIAAKGGTVASGDGFDDFATAIASIPSGSQTEVVWHKVTITVTQDKIEVGNEVVPYIESLLPAGTTALRIVWIPESGDDYSTTTPSKTHLGEAFSFALNNNNRDRKYCFTRYNPADDWLWQNTLANYDGPIYIGDVLDVYYTDSSVFRRHLS